MSKAIIEDHGNVAILRLNNGVTNAICPQMLKDMHASLQEISKSFKGLALTGGEKFFCIGFDLPALLALGREKMADFWLASLQGMAFSAIKDYRLETIKSKYAKHGRSKDEFFLDCWFSRPVQKLLQEAAKYRYCFYSIMHFFVFQDIAGIKPIDRMRQMQRPNTSKRQL